MGDLSEMLLSSLLLETLRNAELSLAANAKAVRRGGYHTNDMADALERTLAPIRAAIKQASVQALQPKDQGNG